MTAERDRLESLRRAAALTTSRMLAEVPSPPVRIERPISHICRLFVCLCVCVCVCARARLMIIVFATNNNDYTLMRIFMDGYLWNFGSADRLERSASERVRERESDRDVLASV